MGNTFCVFCGCVDQANIGVVESWGRFQKLAQPGFHFFNPFAGECLAGVLSTRISSLDVRIETKTKDNVFVQLLCSIQYRVIKENADDAFYELQNPKEQIQAYVFDVVRAHVPRMTLDELFEQKGDVAQAVLEELEKFECLADRRQTSKSATYIANRPTIQKNQGRIMTMSSLQSTPLLHMLEQVMGLGRRMAWIFCVE